MDKFQRDRIMDKARQYLSTIVFDMADASLVEHSDRKYNSMVLELQNVVNKVQNLESSRQSKGIFAKLGDKINGVSPEEREIDELLVKSARIITRLENCAGCKCIDCIRDSCKSTCAQCPDGGKVVYCPRGTDDYTMRKVNSWFVKIDGDSNNYEVLAMFTRLKDGASFLYMKPRTNEGRVVAKYSRAAGKAVRVTDDLIFDEICDAAAKTIGI